MDEIDIVIPWVDGNDPKWQENKHKFENVRGDFRLEQYRDWEQLKYLFRGIEKYAPWVRQIHFITCGHVPTWLNVNHPKLHIVKHDDYIPEQYLPTFSSHPIELNMHRIEGLSETFIYFNDDYFIINDIKPEYFFKNGIPCSEAGLGLIGPVGKTFAGILFNDYRLLDRNFNSKKTIISHLSKFINVRYGLKQNLKTISLLPWCAGGFFPGFYNAHGPNAFLKSTLSEVWNAEKDVLDATCKNRFRTTDDVNQYVFLWWQWCKGLISPINYNKLSMFLTVEMDDDLLINTITSQKTPIVVINDDWVEDFNKKKAIINGAFDIVLGEKSSFEI